MAARVIGCLAPLDFLPGCDLPLGAQYAIGLAGGAVAGLALRWRRDRRDA